MKKNIAFLSLMFLIAVFNCYGANVTKNISLEVGGEAIVTIPNLKGISNAGDMVEEVVLSDGESIKLRGLAWGETQITAWDSLGNQWLYMIEVKKPKFVSELQNFLQEIEGVDVNFLGKNIIVEGQIFKSNDLTKLKGILENFPQVKNMVNQTIPKNSDVLIESIKAELYKYNLKYSFLGEGLMYEGQVYNEEDANFAKTLGKIYFDSSYPAIEVMNPELEINVSFIEFTPFDNSQKEFSSFLKTFENQGANKELINYVFYDSSSADQCLEKLNECGQVRPVNNLSMKCKSASKYLWESKANDTTRFYIEFIPKISSSKWVDCRVNFVLEKNKQNLCWQTQRIIARNGQGSLTVGLLNAFINTINANEKAILSAIPILSPFMDSSKSNSRLLILITPKWSIKS